MGFFSEFKWFNGKKDKPFVAVEEGCAEKALKEPEKKIVKKLVFYPVDFDVKRVLVEVTLQDKRKFKTFIYGSVYQHCVQRSKGYNGYVNEEYVKGHYVNEAQAYDPIVSDGLRMAQDWIKFLSSAQLTIVDDIENPKKCVIGQIVSAVIKEVYPYSMTFQVGKIEEVLDEEVK